MKKYFLFALILSLWTGVGCERRQTTMGEEIASEETLTEVTDRAIEEIAELAMPLPGGGGAPCAGSLEGLGGCAQVTDSGEGVYPRTVVVDFGTGCTSPSGVTRSGSITWVDSGDLLETVGATRTCTLTDFAVNNRAVTGTRVRTFTGINDAGQPTYTFQTALTIVRNGNTFTRSASGSSIWLSGYDTPECGDNVVQRDGTATVSGPSGNTRTRTFVAVVHDQPCGYPISGTVQIDRPGPDVSIDYGDGTCDNWATVVRGNNTFLLDLETHTLTPQ
ncbi:MAG: hypothetical protein RJA19_219 [Bacteroidota bacterium]